MRQLLLFSLVAVLASAATVGCGSNRRGGGGPPPPRDSGTPPADASDSCATVVCPPGQTCNPATLGCEPTGTDCTVTGCPTGQICNPVNMLCETMTPCGEHVVPRQFASCDAETVDCITMGGDLSTCVSGDSDPTSCNGCINDNLISCANDMGCQADWNQVRCCADDLCGGLPIDDACLTGPCATQWDTYDTCLGTLGMGVCVPYIESCIR